MADIIVVGIVIACAVGVIFKMYRDKKAGKSCGGCSCGSSCGCHGSDDNDQKGGCCGH